MKNFRTIAFSVLIFILASSLFFQSYSTTSDNKNLTIIEHGLGSSIVDENVNEFINSGVPQNLDLFYKDAKIAEKIMISKQESLNSEFDKIFFSVWSSNCQYLSDSEFKNMSKIKKAYYSENFHIWNKEEIASLIENCNIKNYPSKCKLGIIIRNTIGSSLPTDKPFFDNIKKPGGSFPFNENVSSMIKIGTPVKIIHESSDGSWLFIKSHVCEGWYKAQDIAYVDENFIQTYQQKALAVCTADDISLRSETGIFIAKAQIGTVLPIEKEKICIPFKNEHGFAQILKTKNKNFAKKPYKFTASNIIEIAKKMLGTKYGWGGYLEHRDCSSLIADFMAVFGIWIVRTSTDQITSGTYIDFKTQDINEKIKLIKNNGIPFLSIVGRKGHVMLYIGTHNGTPVFLHNIWALKKENSRYIIGKTILSTSYLPFKDAKNKLSNPLLDEMTTLKTISK